MRALFTRWPILAAVGLWLANIIIQGVGAVAFQAVAPQIPELIQRFLLLLLLCALTAGLLFALRYWREAGYIAPSRWRSTWLIWLPLLLSFLPLVGGVTLPDGGTLALLVTGYLATGFFEESLFRGVMLGFLRARGVTLAVILSSALFGASHLTRLFFGSSPATVGWQVFFAFCFGVAFCALRLRTGTIWPLILIHGVWDFLLNVGHLPMMLYPVSYLILLGYGIFLLWRARAVPGAVELRTEAGAALAAEATTSPTL